MTVSCSRMLGRLFAGFVCASCVTFACSCTRTSSTPAASASSVRRQRVGALVPAGGLQQDKISLEYAIYYLPKPTKDPLAELDSLLKRRFTGIHRLKKKGRETGPTVAARLEANPLVRYRPPDLKMLQYFGHGLTEAQGKAVQTTQAVLIAHFAYGKGHVWDGVRSATELIQVLAESTGGLIWDETSRELFSPVAWKEQRIANWTETVPDISKFTVIHAYQDGPFVRAVTFGMVKFGLPDVVISDFPWSLSRNMAIIANLFSQALAEGAVIPKAGEFDLKISEIKNAKVRDAQLKSFKAKATGVALLTVLSGTWKEGDPENRLVEIAFDRGAGPDPQAQQVQILSTAFGSEDSVTRLKTHSESLEAASRQARQALPRLRADFNKGLAPGEVILLKAPFAQPTGGTEWMWVEVTTWKGDKITGVLSNEPDNVPSLHAGQVVEIAEAKVFDYIRHHADGTTDGNETGKILSQQ